MPNVLINSYLPAPANVLPPPIVTAVATGASTVSVSWTHVTGVFYYILRRNGVVIDTTSANGYSDSGLNPATLYEYTVSCTNAYGEGAQSAPADVTTFGGGGGGTAVKWHPGHYMASNNFDGTGTSNNAEFSALNGMASNIKGWLGYYTWSAIEHDINNYSWDYGSASNTGVAFHNIIADFNALQSTAPGRRFAVCLQSETFGNLGTDQSIYVNGNGVPDYILNGSTYGPLGPNGHQYGYDLMVVGGNIISVVAAAWRSAVNARIIALIQALASTSFVTTAGPYAGQTFTFDTHPLIEGIGYGNDVFQGLQTDYTVGAYLTQQHALHAAVIPSLPHTTYFEFMDFLTGDDGSKSQMVAAMADMYTTRAALSGPDIYGPPFPYVSDASNIYVGGSCSGGVWSSSGGTNYKNKMPYFALVQNPDYGHGNNVGNPSTPAQIFQSIQNFGATHAFWTMYGTRAPYNGYGELDFYTTFIKPLADATPTWNVTCPDAYGSCNIT